MGRLYCNDPTAKEYIDNQPLYCNCTQGYDRNITVVKFEKFMR